METRHLRYFLAVVDHGSVSRASDWLGIAQPALSQALTRMEKDLGVRLFERSRQGTTPTPAAQAILEDVRASVARIDAAARRAAARSGEPLPGLRPARHLVRPRRGVPRRVRHGRGLVLPAQVGA